MNSFKLLGFFGAWALSFTGSAMAQLGSNSLPSNDSGLPPVDASSLSIVMEQGFDLATVIDVARKAGIQQIQTVQTSAGQIALMTPPEGATFVVKTTFCEGGICSGLHFMTFYQLDNLNPAQFDLNDFNANVPLGNVAYLAENSQFVAQRAITNFSGITRGSLEGEIGFFIGYSEGFSDWLNSNSGLVAVSAIDSTSEASKIKNRISLTGAIDYETDAGEVFRLLKETGASDELLYAD